MLIYLKKLNRIIIKKVEVEYISIDDIDYLYNPITKYIYDFETHSKIGKLDNHMNIIKKY